METGDGARRVTQRHLEAPAEDVPVPALAPPPDEGTLRPEPPATRPPISREASAVGLRERQERWLRERARFEALEAQSSSMGEGTK
jgi:hypothetical protein